MTSLDLVLLAIVAVSALFGLMRGLVGTVVSLLAWGLAGWMAFHHGSDIALLMARHGPPTPADLLAGYALAFIGVLVLDDAAREHLPTIALLLAIALTAATVDRLTRPERTDR